MTFTITVSGKKTSESKPRGLQLKYVLNNLLQACCRWWRLNSGRWISAVGGAQLSGLSHQMLSRRRAQRRHRLP